MSKPIVAVLDYGIGNIRSVGNGVLKVGGQPQLTRDESEIKNARGLILPGVGAFQMGMANLKKYSLDKIIHNFISTGKPVIGICLGMQMLFETSDEYGVSEGLGLIRGKVVRLPVTSEETARLPHVGWNKLLPPTAERWTNSLLSGTNADQSFYFVHSFGGFPTHSEDTLAETSYGGCRFASAVSRENVSGFQFHPEKSGEAGLAILRKFVERCA